MSKKIVFNPFTSNFDTISEVVVTAVGGSPNSAGASIDAQQNLTLQPANALNPGIVSTAAQTFSGDKLFSDNLSIAPGKKIDVFPAGALNLATITASSLNIGKTSLPIALSGAIAVDAASSLALNQLTVSRPLKVDGSGIVISGLIDISSASDITGTLPIANGGTNSVAALNNNRVIISNSGALVEAAAISANKALLSDASGIPVASSVTNTELSYVSGVTSSIQTQLDNKSDASPGDISETSFALSDNVAVAADVTSLLFPTASIRGFEAIVSISIDATSDVYEIIKIYGINRGGVWEMSQVGAGDESGVTLTITLGGQIQYTNTTHAGFVSGVVKFRATTLAV